MPSYTFPVEKYLDKLSLELLTLLHKIGSLGDFLGVKVYVVGGFVRDLFLKQQNLDIDICVEGNGSLFAQALTKELFGSIKVYHRFATAIIFYNNESKQPRRIDVATARRETYKKPGDLPCIEYTSIENDLFRRDFTINSLAMQLNVPQFGTIIDLYEGQQDILEKHIAILHDKSFIDDPTRIFRAVRFEQRFDFTLTEKTEHAIKECIEQRIINCISGERLFKEWKLICNEKKVTPCLKRLHSLKVLQEVHHFLLFSKQIETLCLSIDEVFLWYTSQQYNSSTPEKWILYMLAFCRELTQEESRCLFKRLHLSKKYQSNLYMLQEKILDTSNRIEEYYKSSCTTKVDLYPLLSFLPLEALLYLQAYYQKDTLIYEDVALAISRICK